MCSHSSLLESLAVFINEKLKSVRTFTEANLINEHNLEREGSTVLTACQKIHQTMKSRSQLLLKLISSLLSATMSLNT